MTGAGALPPEPPHDAFVVLGDEAFLGQLLLLNVHPPEQCAGQPCTIHNPSDHPMRSWLLLWHGHRQAFYRACGHGLLHPDPDQYDFWADARVLSARMAHECCPYVCCQSAVMAFYERRTTR